MNRFEKQTYTQTPNSLFAIMKDMDECELKVVLLICRYTFGYHRDEIKLSTRRIAKEIGMSIASVDKGADAAVSRGLIERITDGQKTTVWRALVSDSENESPVIQKMNQTDSENESQVRVKESIKKEKEIKNPFLSQSEIEEIEESANKKVDAILKLEVEALKRKTAGTAWRGRELLRDAHIPYGDCWHEMTGLEMYGIKEKQKVDAEWLKGFAQLEGADITIENFKAGYAAEKWRGYPPLLVVVKTAKAIQAAGGIKTDETQGEYHGSISA